MAFQCARNGAQILITVIIYVLKSTKEQKWETQIDVLKIDVKEKFLDDRNVIQEWIKSKYNDTLER